MKLTIKDLLFPELTKYVWLHPSKAIRMNSYCNFVSYLWREMSIWMSCLKSISIAITFRSAGAALTSENPLELCLTGCKTNRLLLCIKKWGAYYVFFLHSLYSVLTDDQIGLRCGNCSSRVCATNGTYRRKKTMYVVRSPSHKKKCMQIIEARNLDFSNFIFPNMYSLCSFSHSASTQREPSTRKCTLLWPAEKKGMTDHPCAF